jgi:hypothetical protein
VYVLVRANVIEQDKTVNEVWRSISGYINYQVSNIGRVRNTATGHIMTNQMSHKGYYRTRLSKDKHITEYEIHRLVAQEFVPKPNVEHKLVVDHIDRNKLNNQVSNLRYVSYSQNHVNSSKRSRITTSKYKGVSWDAKSKKWRAKLVKDRQDLYLGAYDNEVDAAKAYNERAIAEFGPHAYLNDITEDDDQDQDQEACFSNSESEET